MAAPFIYVPSDGRSGEDALLKAALDGDLGRIKGILKRLGIGNGDPAAVFSLNIDGFGVMHLAAIQGHLEVCKYLVEELGGDPNMIDGSCKVIEFLLSKGIPVDIDFGRGTPLYHAATNEQDKTLKILLKHNANPNAILSEVGTPLMSARYRSLKCMKLLIKAGADVNGKGSFRSPLLFATGYGGYTDFVQLLLQAGADPNVPDDMSQTGVLMELSLMQSLKLGWLPIECAALRKCREEIKMLLPLTSPIPGVPNWSIDGDILCRAKKYKALG